MVFAGAETKTGQPLEFDFPSELVAALDRYLQHHRPVLAARGCRGTEHTTDALWLSAHGAALGEAAITRQIADHTREAFGVPLSPHLFRDSVATAIAVEAPERAHLIQTILGHATPVTAEHHYNLPTSLEAGRRHAETIEIIRKRRSLEPGAA